MNVVWVEETDIILIRRILQSIIGLLIRIRNISRELQGAHWAATLRLAQKLHITKLLSITKTKLVYWHCISVLCLCGINYWSTGKAP